MKIATVTQDELNKIWYILQPMNRVWIAEDHLSGGAIRIGNTLIVGDAEFITFQQAVEEARSANIELDRRRGVHRSVSV